MTDDPATIPDDQLPADTEDALPEDATGDPVKNDPVDEPTPADATDEGDAPAVPNG